MQEIPCEKECAKYYCVFDILCARFSGAGCYTDKTLPGSQLFCLSFGQKLQAMSFLVGFEVKCRMSLALMEVMLNFPEGMPVAVSMRRRIFIIRATSCFGRESGIFLRSGVCKLIPFCAIVSCAIRPDSSAQPRQ